jgi:PadR family transcriptional regulator, regulatory protein PadR
VKDQELYSGLLRLHILHHACEGEVYGLDMIEELARHGYKLSPGTMYPILHELERKGYVRSSTFRSGRICRRLYKGTPAGRKALKEAKQKVKELFGQLIEGK